MAIPAGYTYHDGAYWKTGGYGPYAIDDLGNPSLMGASIVTVNGDFFLRGPDGVLVPLAIIANTPEEGTVAGVLQQQVEFDAGSDTDLVEALLTANCTTGDPDTHSQSLASARFSNPDANAEVYKTQLSGSGAGFTLGWYASGGFTMLDFALRGAGPYTLAADAVISALESVSMSFLATLNVVALEIRFGTPYKAGGANYRYRKATVTGYAS